jgi:MFS transporter, DHA3 family, macrolide efflux protein
MTVRDVLRLPDFRRLWLAQAISDVGDGLALLTLMLLVNQLTGSTLALAGVAMALAIPPLTIGIVAGTYVDRWDRRTIMIVSDSLRAVIVLGFVVVGRAELVPLLLVLAFAQATIGTFFSPARGALIPRVVPADGLLAANAIGQATRVIAGVIGSALAGLIVGVAGVTWPAFVLDSATFAASALLVLGVSRSVGRPSDAERVAASGVGASVLEGLRLIGHSRLLLTTLIALALAMLGLGAVNVLFLPLIVNVLEVSPVWLGAVDIAQSASMILAAGLVAVLAARLRPSTIITVALLATAVLIGLVGATTHVVQVLLLLFAIGWFITPLQAAVVTIFQTGVPDAGRGRAMATLQAAMSGASVVSMALAGVFGDLVGVRNVFVLAGVVVFTGGVAAAVLYRGTGPATILAPPEAAEPGATVDSASAAV